VGDTHINDALVSDLGGPALLTWAGGEGLDRRASFERRRSGHRGTGDSPRGHPWKGNRWCAQRRHTSMSRTKHPYPRGRLEGGGADLAGIDGARRRFRIGPGHRAGSTRPRGFRTSPIARRISRYGRVDTGQVDAVSTPTQLAGHSTVVRPRWSRPWVRVGPGQRVFPVASHRASRRRRGSMPTPARGPRPGCPAASRCVGTDRQRALLGRGQHRGVRRRSFAERR